MGLLDQNAQVAVDRFGMLAGTTRATPAEDVIDALRRLNAALAAAARAGRTLTVTLGDRPPSVTGAGAIVPVISANPQKAV